MLGLPRPDPASDDTRDNAYVFERRVQFAHGDGTSSLGRDTLASAPAPLTESELADRFTGRGRWRERLPRILDMLVALGNVKHAEGRYRRA